MIGQHNFNEEQVCVQPFVIAKSLAGGAVTNVNNLTWEQLEYGIPNGRMPLSSWTYNQTDTNTFIYLYQRTADSGTRRCWTQGNYYQFNDPVGIYCYDATNNALSTLPTVLTNFELRLLQCPAERRCSRHRRSRPRQRQHELGASATSVVATSPTTWPSPTPANQAFRCPLPG